MRRLGKKTTHKASARDVTVGLLARREHSRAELLWKLTQRGYPVDEVTGLLDQLEEQNLLSESRYVASYVRSRVERGYGPLKILAELRQRKIPDALSQEELGFYNGRWLTLAKQYYQRHFNEPPADYRERAKRWRHMQQHGFDADTLKRVFAGIGEVDAD